MQLRQRIRKWNNENKLFGLSAYLPFMEEKKTLFECQKESLTLYVAEDNDE